MEVVRKNLQDGQPAAYLFTSPCCAARTLLAAWVVEYARRRTGGRLLIQCGRDTTDPLRAAGALPGDGCGRPYLVDMVERGAPGTEPPRS
jgi:hypothetical protein